MRVLIGLLGRWAAPVAAAVLLYYQNSPPAHAWRSTEMLVFLVLLGAASVKALNAGVDLLLIAYDPD